LLALKVRPAPDKARGQVIELRELHLQLAFVGLRALREDVEDQAGPVQYTALEESLEVAFLAGRRRVIEDDNVGVFRGNDVTNYLGLAAADEIFRVGCMARAHDSRKRNGARRQRELAQLVEGVGIVVTAEIKMHEDGALPAIGTVKQRATSRAMQKLRSTKLCEKPAGGSARPYPACRAVADACLVLPPLAVFPQGPETGDQPTSASSLPLSSSDMRTARAGTTVEIACL